MLGEPCRNGLASHPGGVEMLLGPSCYVKPRRAGKETIQVVVLTYFTLSFPFQTRLYSDVSFYWRSLLQTEKMSKDTSLKAEIKRNKFVWEDRHIPPARSGIKH